MASVGISQYRSRLDPTSRLVERREPVVWGDADGPLDGNDLATYERDGYFQDHALIGPDEVLELIHEVERLVADPAVAESDLVIREPGTDEIRSVFDVDRISSTFERLFTDERIVGLAQQVLGSSVYIHQSRVNRKPGFRGRDFYWHSDFETWHSEDGMPAMRAVTIALAMTENRVDNGSLMVIPRSHHTFVGCVGATPENHYRRSLRAQEYGIPDDESLASLVDAGGIATITGPPGSAVAFDSNLMHGSNSNITPYDRCTAFVVFNSTENQLVDPVGGTPPRPEFLARRTVGPT